MEHQIFEILCGIDILFVVLNFTKNIQPNLRNFNSNHFGCKGKKGIDKQPMFDQVRLFFRVFLLFSSGRQVAQ
jgi:hypothetical protein